MKTPITTADSAQGGSHEFVLVLEGVAELSPSILDALFESGCDDATPMVRRGRVYLGFVRDAPTLRDAILSAIRDVRRAGIGAEVLRVDDSNLVSQAEIARRIDRSRQMVGQYISGKRGPGEFPPPVRQLADGHEFWLWSDVALWLSQNGIVPESVVRDSRDVAVINNVLEMIHQRKWENSPVSEVLRVAGGS